MLVNDLDLLVIDPDGKCFKGNVFVDETTVVPALPTNLRGFLLVTPNKR
jgi:hypothetical protein